MSDDAYTLEELFSGAQERFGDYPQRYGSEPDQVAVLRHSLRLSPKEVEALQEIPKRVEEVQADPPEVEAARKKYNAAKNRLDTLSEDAPDKVREEHANRVAEELKKLEATTAEHGIPVGQQMAAVREVVHDMIRTAVAEPRHADGLIAALGTDVTVHLLLTERYLKKIQLGEAQPSGA